MQRLQLDEDIKPLSEFCTNTDAMIQRLQETKRPLVLTQHGRNVAVLLDIDLYERLLSLREAQETDTDFQSWVGLGLTS